MEGSKEVRKEGRKEGSKEVSKQASKQASKLSLKVSKTAVMYRDSLQLLIGIFDIFWDFLVSFGTLGIIFRDLSTIF